MHVRSKAPKISTFFLPCLRRDVSSPCTSPDKASFTILTSWINLASFLELVFRRTWPTSNRWLLCKSSSVNASSLRTHVQILAISTILHSADSSLSWSSESERSCRFHVFATTSSRSRMRNLMLFTRCCSNCLRFSALFPAVALMAEITAERFWSNLANSSSSTSSTFISGSESNDSSSSPSLVTSTTTSLTGSSADSSDSASLSSSLGLDS
mmetsp:Transcript_11623/g.19920  ORF Transcript_11623/g.19920 Transcript_11623/m.19920 type:complete len:212 (-) Transcript_11623:204-839(-)